MGKMSDKHLYTLNINAGNFRVTPEFYYVLLHFILLRIYYV